MGLNKYTISIYTEDNVGLLNRISAIFLKRHINIISITSSESEISHIFRFIIVVQVDFIQIKKLVKQIEKQIEVIAAFLLTSLSTYNSMQVVAKPVMDLNLKIHSCIKFKYEIGLNLYICA